LTAAPPLAAFIIGLAAGPAADLVITRRWLSVTATRKLFTFVGKFYYYSLLCQKAAQTLQMQHTVNKTF